MKTPSPADRAVPLVIGLVLCAACFQAGRTYQELATAGTARAKADPGNELVHAAFVGPQLPAPPETAPATAPGEAPGDGGDIITPLNVRDPSALVMGPGASFQDCSAPPPPEPPAREIKPRKLKEGRLLELLKKGGGKSPEPKRF